MLMIDGIGQILVSRSNHLKEVNVKVIVQLLMLLVQLQCGMRCVLFLEGWSSKVARYWGHLQVVVQEGVTFVSIKSRVKELFAFYIFLQDSEFFGYSGSDCCHIEIWHLVQHKFTSEEMLVFYIFVFINSIGYWLQCRMVLQQYCVL